MKKLNVRYVESMNSGKMILMFVLIACGKMTGFKIITLIMQVVLIR